MEIDKDSWVTDLDTVLGALKSQLEKMINERFDVFVKEICKLENEILKNYKEQGDWNRDKQELFRVIDSRLDNLEQKFNELESWKHVRFAQFNKTPHKCPVCNGYGRRQDETRLEIVDCTGCQGASIVWG